MLSSQLLAVVTTCHLALAALKNHRTASSYPIGILAFPSFALGITPWIFSSLAGTALGLAANVAWFFISELISFRPASVAAPAVAAAPRSAPAVQSTAASARRSNDFVQTPVLATCDETSDIKTIRLARPAGFEFEPGQFLTLRIRANGADCVRCYSISSAPHARGYLEVSIKRQGIVSSALHGMARPGATIAIKRPNGRFTYPAGDDRPIVLLAGGVGITPLMSMLRHAIVAEPSRPVTLLYSAPSERDFAFLDELASIAKRHPQARVLLAASRDKAPRRHIYPGRIDDALIRNTVPAIAHAISFICGPAPMVDGMKTLLASLGVPRDQIRFELFQAAVAASAAAGAGEDRAAPAVRAAAAASMRCSQAGKTVVVAAGQTLLEAAEDAGIEVPVLCRAGVCGTCRTRVVSGDVDCATTTLDESDRAGGYVLPCVSTARTDCVVEL